MQEHFAMHVLSFYDTVLREFFEENAMCTFVTLNKLIFLFNFLWTFWNSLMWNISWKVYSVIARKKIKDWFIFNLKVRITMREGPLPRWLQWPELHPAEARRLEPLLRIRVSVRAQALESSFTTLPGNFARQQLGLNQESYGTPGCGVTYYIGMLVPLMLFCHVVHWAILPQVFQFLALFCFLVSAIRNV